MFLADHFIHGLGGGKYDEVTDQIMREFFGISPPQYQVVTGTLRLNLPRFPTMEEERRRAERYLRDLDWNPQSVSERDDPRWQQLRADKMDLIPLDPPTSAERKARFRRLNALTQQLRAYLEEERLRAGHRLQQIASELDANRLLAQRDYPWLLHSANRLQEFLRPLLD
jgi:hypothetical protein